MAVDGRPSLAGGLGQVCEGDESALMMTAAGGRRPGGDKSGKRGGQGRGTPVQKGKPGPTPPASKKARPRPQHTSTSFDSQGRTATPSSSSRPKSRPAGPLQDDTDMVQVEIVDEAAGPAANLGRSEQDQQVIVETLRDVSSVASDTLEESVARWRQILGMEDGEPVPDGGAFSTVQRDVICDQYRSMPAAERILFCMGLNAFVSTMMMDLTTCIRDVELEVDGGQTEHSDNGDHVEKDETGLMQKQWRLRPTDKTDLPASSFPMLLQTFAAALDRLTPRARRAVAQAMQRQLVGACGRALANNAQALEALLVVHGDGDGEVLDPADDGWLRMWWSLLLPHLGTEGADATASSSETRPAVPPGAPARSAVIDLDSQGSDRTVAEAVTQVESQESQGWRPDTLDDEDLAEIDRILAMEDNQDRGRAAADALGRHEDEDHANAHAIDMSQWMEAYGIEAAAKRAREVAQAEADAVAEAAKHRQAQRELEKYNAEARARTYRDWENWEVLHTPPGPGFASGAGSRQRGGEMTQVEATVRQEGISLGKRARWSLPVNSSKSLTLVFEVGVVGGQVRALNARSSVPVEADKADAGNDTAVARPEQGTSPAVETTAGGQTPLLPAAGVDAGLVAPGTAAVVDGPGTTRKVVERVEELNRLEEDQRK